MVSSPTGGYEAHPLRMGYFILRLKTLYFMLYAMVAWLLCGTQIAHASPISSDTSINALIVHANEKELHLDPGWLKLLHYRKTPFGWRSAADGLDFFLSERGRVNPQSELEATLRGFARPPTEEELLGNAQRMTEEGELPPLQHPVCRFPARLVWLSQQLNLTPEHLAVTDCPKFAEYLALMEPTGASLVFSSYYVENPASTFGHTLLRIHRNVDSEGQPIPALIDHGVNFGAVVGEEKGLRYLVKGMTGLYPGRFSRIGYYIKVREYNDHDSRDLWNYPLNLTPEQVWMLVAHLWELDNTWFAYFFRTENCSYQILSLIEAVVPDVDLLPNRLSAVVPIETVIDAMKIEGFVGEPTVSPALRRQFEARIGPMDKASRKAVSTLQKDANAPLPDTLEQPEQAAILDAAADLIEIRFPNEILLDEPTPEAEHRQQILSRRAQLGVASPALRFSPASVDDPTQGHGRHRLGIEGGVGQEGHPYGRIHYRAALHDWADPSVGFPELEQIEFLPFTLWVDPTHNAVRIEQLSFLRTRSLQPFNRFHRRPSTTMDAGLELANNRGCNNCLGAYFQSGNGVALGTQTHSLVGFVMGQTRLWAIPNLPGIASTPLHLGMGASTGFRLRVSKRITALTEGEVLYYPWQDNAWSWQAEGELRWGLGTRFALGIHAKANSVQSNVGLQVFTYW